MKFKPNSIETIKNKITTRDVCRHFNIKITRTGWIVCPFHPDTQPSMKLYKNGAYCFACNTNADVISLTQNQLQNTYKEAMAYLDHQFGLEIIANKPLTLEQRREIRKTHKEREKQRLKKEQKHQDFVSNATKMHKLSEVAAAIATNTGGVFLSKGQEKNFERIVSELVRMRHSVDLYLAKLNIY